MVSQPSHKKKDVARVEIFAAREAGLLLSLLLDVDNDAVHFIHVGRDRSHLNCVEGNRTSRLNGSVGPGERGAHLRKRVSVGVLLIALESRRRQGDIRIVDPFSARDLEVSVRRVWLAIGEVLLLGEIRIGRPGRGLRSG